MHKQDYINLLKKKLSGLPPKEVDDRLGFYEEMIDDLIEEGVSEEDALKRIGSVDEVASQILADIPLKKLVKEKIKPNRKRSAWEITLLAIGSPIFGALLIAAIAVVFALYASLWAVIISLWASFFAVVGSGVGGFLGGFLLFFTENAASGFCLIGLSLTALGLSIFFFYGCKLATVGIIKLTKKIVLFIKKQCIKKEATA